MRYWLRAVSRGFWLALPATYVVFAIGAAAAGYGELGNQGAQIALSEFWPFLTPSVLLIAALYGFARVVTFCPLTDPDYYGWLKLTPWTPDKRLPLAPLSVTWQDGVIVLLLSGLVWLHGLEYWWLAGSIALLGYGVALVGCFAYVRQFGPAFLAGFALGLPIYFIRQPLWAFIAFAICLGVLQWGLRSFLCAFPWVKEGGPDCPPRRLFAAQRTPSPAGDIAVLRQNGWPYAATDPAPIEKHIPLTHGLLLAALAPWLLTAVVHATSPVLVLAAGDLAWFTGAVAGIASLMRLALYLNGTVWPLSIAGRLAQGKLVIPGFDRVLLAPLCALAASQVVPRVLEAGGVPPLPNLFLSFFAPLACVLCMGPTYSNWVLTGALRFTPPYLSSNAHRKA